MDIIKIGIPPGFTSRLKHHCFPSWQIINISYEKIRHIAKNISKEKIIWNLKYLIIVLIFCGIFLISWYFTFIGLVPLQKSLEEKVRLSQLRGEDPWKRKPDPDPSFLKNRIRIQCRIRIQAKLDYLSGKYGGLFHLIFFSDSSRFFMLI